MKDEHLPFPPQELSIKKDNEYTQVWDMFRKKWVLLTPEEYIRQQYLHYMVNHLGYPSTNIAVEKKVNYHLLSKRFDAVVVNHQGIFLMILEFKKPEIHLNETVLLQATTYAASLKAKSVFITNGHDQMFVYYSPFQQSWIIKNKLPTYHELMLLP